MEKKDMWKIVATAPDGSNRIYVYDNIIDAVSVKLNIDTARGWKSVIYTKIADDWIEL